MRKIYIFFAIGFIFASCEDVIELDLNEAAPRLVIDATIELNEDGTTNAEVLLTRSAGFYEENNPVVTDAQVSVTDENGTVFNFNHTGLGLYTNRLLQVQPDTQYTLSIVDQGETYTATQQLFSTVPIVDVQQETISGLGDDFLRLTALYDDPVGLGDFYLFEYKDALNEQIDIGDDEFSDGNRAPTIFFLEDFEEGIIGNFKVMGIDQRCFTFYDTLIQQTADGGGGPFDTQPATVRGNIVNSTNPENFPFGYFRISQVFEFEYEIQSFE